MNRPQAILALEDESVFHGYSIGALGQGMGEVVFNTAATGYQEILTDPSYCRQIVAFTQPHIGNVGTNEEDAESDRIYVSALVVRSFSELCSNWRSRESLDDYLQRHGIVGITQVDTRRLTVLLRERGALRGCIMPGGEGQAAAAVESARRVPRLDGLDLTGEVGTRTAYEWREGGWRVPESAKPDGGPWRVFVYDYGVKRNILRILTDLGSQVTVVPPRTPAVELLREHPEGIFLSNGPGDPAPCDYAVENIRSLLAARVPTFGICLGHQLLALAEGAQTVKMKFGHHGANHPVQDLESGRVLISSQNHGFTVEERSLPATLRVTHRSLFDGTVQGVCHVKAPAAGFQGHPEASPGPHDVSPIFQRFIDFMRQRRRTTA